MKKIIYIFAIIATTLSFTSCDDDDDAPKQEEIAQEDQLIGKWKLQSVKIGTLDNADSCDLQGTFQVNADGTFSAEDYELDNEDNCNLDVTTNGTWVNGGNSGYTFTSSDKEINILKPEFKDDTFTVTQETILGTATSVYQRK